MSKIKFISKYLNDLTIVKFDHTNKKNNKYVY